ncbi:MAG: hypothetical protein Q8R36_02590, partial [bacterium]|nr:hypothetical protein [bacterium]
EKSSVAPQDARLNIQALVFDVAGNFFYTGKNIFTNIIRAIQDIGVSDSTHTLSLAPFNKDVKEGGVEDVLLSGTENVYLRFTFEGIGNDGVPRVKLQMIQKGVSASTSYIIELEGLDTMILEGQSIELALTGTDIALSLTFDGIQNGVPNIFVELIQTQ